MSQPRPIKHPIPWIRRIAEEIGPQNQVPLFGHAPPFPWDLLSSALSETFGIDNLLVSPAQQQWSTEEEIGSGLGIHPTIYPIFLSPLHTPIYFAISQADRQKFIAHILHGHESESSFSSELLQEGFFQFALLHAFEAAQSLELFQALTLHLGEDSPLPHEKSFCVDVALHVGKNSCWARIIIPTSFQKEWIHHFSAFPSEYSPTQLSQKLSVTLGVKIGNIHLTQKEWKRVKLGDFILIDQTLFAPLEQTGSVFLMLGTKPLFAAKIEKNELQLTDYAFIHEEIMHETPEENPSSPPPLEAAEEEAIAIKDLPLHISVELSRVKMTLDGLMKLSPGNTLELPVLPEETVTLTVNGQKVGRGELVYLGETLGVRIVEMG